MITPVCRCCWCAVPTARSAPSSMCAVIAARALPVAEKYGMIWVGLQPQTRLDPDALLDGVADDLAAYRLDAYHHYETRVLRRQLNWKLAIDTFCETYHLSYLHPD